MMEEALMARIEEQAKEIEQLNESKLFIESSYNTIHMLCNQKDKTIMELDNEIHDKSMMVLKLANENKQLRDMMKCSMEVVSFYKSHFTGTVGEYLKYTDLISDINKLLKGDGVSEEF